LLRLPLQDFLARNPRAAACILTTASDDDDDDGITGATGLSSGGSTGFARAPDPDAFCFSSGGTGWGSESGPCTGIENDVFVSLVFLAVAFDVDFAAAAGWCW
jgi:hypothetical protein